MQETPNILLLVLDGVRSDRMSCYGHHRPTTPFLNDFAGDAALFENHYSVGNESMPVHISMLSGIHGAFHGAGSNESVYDGRYPLITELLKEKGYSTVGVSSQNPYFQLDTGFIRGFDRYWTVVKSSKQMRLWGMRRSWMEAPHRFLRNLPGFSRIRAAAETSGKTYRALSDFYLRNDHSGQMVVETLIKEFQTAKQNGTPAFWFANIVDAHRPFLPMAQYRHLFESATLNERVLQAMFDPYAILSGRLRLDPHEIESLRNLYDAGIRYVDDLVRQLVGAMKSLGLLENTLVVITSDHGEMLLEKEDLLGHGTSMYEGMIKVPLIMRHPALFPSGVIDNRLACTIDLFATIASAAGIHVQKGSFEYQGLDLSRKSDVKSWRHFVVSEEPSISYPERLYAFPEILHRYLNIERAMIGEEYKYVWHSSGDHRLNRRDDVTEEVNLYGRDYREQISKMRTELFEWYGKQVAVGDIFDPEQFKMCGYHPSLDPVNTKNIFVRPVDPPETVKVIYDAPR